MSAFLTSIEGNQQLLDGGAMFGNAPRPVWEKWAKPDERGRIPLACRAMLLEFDGLKVLCETGIGAFFEPKMAERFGVQAPEQHLLLENLAKAGVKPEEIDYVILSHLHFDHAGGLLPTYKDMQSGKTDLVFPEAKFMVGKEAWARALAPHSRDKASFIPELNQKLEVSGRLLRIGQDPLPKELASRFEFIESNGHTPGQLHTLFKGDQGKVFFCGDLVPGKAWVHLPITMGYDRFPEMLIDEKAQVYKRALTEDWVLFFTHDVDVAGARINNVGGRFEAIDIHHAFSHFAI